MTERRLKRAMGRTGWLRRVLIDAADAIEDIDALCGQMHPASEPCSFCSASRRLKRSLPHARRQLDAINRDHVLAAVGGRRRA